MKREMPSFLFMVMVGLVMFFVYAVFVIGMDVHNMIAVHTTWMSSFGTATLDFATENRDLLLGTAAVLLIIRILTHSPHGKARL